MAVMKSKKLTRKEFIEQVEKGRIWMLLHKHRGGYDLNINGGFKNLNVKA